MVLCSSIFAQLYLLPYNPLNGIGQENKAYAQKEFKMRISVDQDPIQQGDTQKITVTVRDANTNDKISDAFVKLAIDPPSGKVATGSSHTDDNGQTTFNVRISSDADTGTFNVAARASENGYASNGRLHRHGTGLGEPAAGSGYRAARRPGGPGRRGGGGRLGCHPRPIALRNMVMMAVKILRRMSANQSEVSSLSSRPPRPAAATDTTAYSAVAAPLSVRR